MIGVKLTEFVIDDTIPSVDITVIRTYSDISYKIFYSSIPSIFVALILFGFFYKMIGDFHITMTNDSYGDNLKVLERERIRDSKIPPFVKGLNIPFLLGVIGIIIIWARL